jgi:hypothetical protein
MKLRTKIGWLVPLSLALGSLPAGAADCDSKAFEISVPDAATLKLSDGVHTIAKAKAPHGEFEARVRVKAGNVSENEFWANGKKLELKLDPKTPSDFQRCLKSQKVEISSVGFAEEMLHALSGLVEQRAEAATRACVYRVTATCYEYSSGKYWCSYHVCCGSSCHVEFDPVP